MIYSANCRDRLLPTRPIVLCLLLQSLVQFGAIGQTSEAGEPIKLKDELITESSGLVHSLHTPGHFWTHNDSGDGAALYAFDATGHPTGHAKLRGVKAEDWEDMAAFNLNGQPWLIVADTGDNALRRKSVSLFLFPEPDPTEQNVAVEPLELKCQYPDGAKDCEGIAVDTQLRQIWLVTKSALPYAMIYTLPLPEISNRKPLQRPSIKHQETLLTKVGMIAIPLVTGMAIDQESRDLVVINYLCAFRYSLRSEKPWWQTEAALFELPKLKQIEAIAITPDHRWWITSEGKPCLFTTVDQPRVQSNAESVPQ